tara:strand:- start:3211 stop:3462 length:252 start_codon:yes stop_codon:yes gene_type:complete
MYSDFENKVLESLRKEFGKVYESLEEEVVMSKAESARKLYELSVEKFRINQSAQNYNMLILGMITLQYWNQKKVRLFNITEDF